MVICGFGIFLALGHKGYHLELIPSQMADIFQTTFFKLISLNENI